MLNDSAAFSMRQMIQIYLNVNNLNFSYRIIMKVIGTMLLILALVLMKEGLEHLNVIPMP